MTKEKIKRIMLGLAIFGFVLIVFNLVLMAIFGSNAKIYLPWAAMGSLISQTITYIVAIVVFILLIIYLSNKEST